jgi:hypothetical protein
LQAARSGGETRHHGNPPVHRALPGQNHRRHRHQGKIHHHRHARENAGRPVAKTWVGGNIGKSLLADLDKISPADLVVLELSSFMLEHLRDLRWSPHVALVTMISSDHLEWHGSQEAYVDAKRNIVRFQQPEDFAVLNEDDPTMRRLCAEAQGRLFLRPEKPQEIRPADPRNPQPAQRPGRVRRRVDFRSRFHDRSAISGRFRGFAASVAAYSTNPAASRYYNDSIATIPEAAVAALESFPAKKSFRSSADTARTFRSRRCARH